MTGLISNRFSLEKTYTLLNISLRNLLTKKLKMQEFGALKKTKY